MMRSFIKSSFLWQFSGGFVLGALGLFAMQPAEATQSLTSHIAHIAKVQR